MIDGISSNLAQGALFYPISVFNILTEIIIVIQPFMMMRNVQMTWDKRVKILCSFSSRLRYDIKSMIFSQNPITH